ncbi:thermonuclease family protein [Bacillales bacterium AN1005]|uniref:thermonuclease family protein n=1 Tax=Niallia taxi TaxID=2499688 RepID=UPI0021A75CF4|nr:thermonuclease family protein [Niallia taxi]MCT2347195.1 thermonuclease family protein [Niallia taxi]
MKKTKLFTLMLILLLVITGCSTEKTGSKSEGEVASDKANNSSGGDSLSQEEEFGEVKNPQSELEDITVEVKVDRVIDGDTVEITNEDGEKETVRLLLIDTPESVDPNEEVQAYGEEASEFAKIRLQDSRVLLERGNPEKDEYGRTLGYIWLKNGADRVNFAELALTEGMARVAYVNEQNAKYLKDFEVWEQEAKDEKLNIWSVDGYVKDDGFDMSVMQ